MNKNHAVKKFLKEPGHIDKYPEIKIRWVGGHNPDLVIFGAGDEEAERIDLTAYRSVESLHALVEEKGFRKKGDTCVGAECDAEL